MSNPLAHAWDNSKGAEKPQFSELPDGKYIGSVDHCKMGTTKKEEPKIEWQFTVTEGTHKNSKHWIHRVLDVNNPVTIDRAKSDFLDLGLTADSASLKTTMEGLTSKLIEFDIQTGKQGGKFTNLKRIIEPRADGPSPF